MFKTLVISALFVCSIGHCIEDSPYTAFLVTMMGGSGCSSFAIQNQPDSDKDLAITAAHCFFRNKKTKHFLPARAEWGGHLKPIVIGQYARFDDIAVLQGSIPDKYKAIPIAGALPKMPFRAYFLGFNIYPPEPGKVGTRFANIFGFYTDGSLLGGGNVIPGNSGGPLIYIDKKGKHQVVGVTYAYSPFSNMGYWTPLHVLQKAVKKAMQYQDKH